MRVLIFGDNSVHGFWDLEYGGWVQRLRKEYDRQTIKHQASESLEFFNLGISGDTVSGVVKRLPYEIEARRWADEPFVLVFAVGINDTIFRGKEVASTPEQYRDELDMLVGGAQRYAKRILFVGLTPVDDKLCNPWVYSSSKKSFSNERILLFEEVLRKFCIDKGLACVQLFETFQSEQQSRELLADGLHPNDAGHQLIADLVRPALDKAIQS